jgi:hypothetical protein
MQKLHTKLSNQEFKIKQDWKNGMEDLLFGPWLLPARPHPKPKRRRANALSPSRPHRLRPQPARRSDPLAGRGLGSPRTHRQQPHQPEMKDSREREGFRAGGHWVPVLLLAAGQWAPGAAVVSLARRLEPLARLTGRRSRPQLAQNSPAAA